MRLYKTLNRFLSKMVNAIAVNSEPKVIEEHDRSGSTHYQTYDPISQTHATLNSEAEVRAWLDQRHA
jgi:hypothetical protein